MGAVDIFIGEAILIIIMFVIILSSLLAASNSLPFQFSSLSKPSVRVPNPCNTQEGTQCVFPFTYLGVEYYKCTYAASPVPWCATMVGSNGTVVTNKWGDCSNSALSSCPVESIDVPFCVTQGGPQDNMPCVFPFRHLGVTYTSCTTIGKDMAWCSTNTTSGGSMWMGTMDTVQHLVLGQRTIRQQLLVQPQQQLQQQQQLLQQQHLPLQLQSLPHPPQQQHQQPQPPQRQPLLQVPPDR